MEPLAILSDAFVAAAIIQYSGNTDMSEQIIKNMYVGISLR